MIKASMSGGKRYTGEGLMMKSWVSKVLVTAALLMAICMGGMAGQTRAATVATKTPAFTFKFTCASAVDHVGGQVCVHTNAGATVSITVRYCTGHTAVSNSLKGAKHANSAGNASWWWKPDTKCRGNATATIKAIWHGITYWRAIVFKVK
jgi:hypothetical protein